MEVYNLFYDNVPKYLKYAILALLLFVSLCANGIFLGSVTDMYSSSGYYAEVYTMAYNAVYIGMGIAMVFFVKLATRFTSKDIILSGFTFMLPLHFIIANTDTPIIVILSSFLLGIAKVMGLGGVYLEWLKIWSKQYDSSRLYPFLYFIALGGQYFITWVMSYTAYLFDWRQGYIVIYILIVLSVISIIYSFEKHPLKNKIPLYQLDLPGIAFLAIAMMSFNFVIVYGKVENWFASGRITLSFLSFLLFLLLFLRREIIAKRPLLPLKLLTTNNFGRGLIYFLLLGLFIPMTLQSSFSGGILQLESIRVSEINLYLLPGIIAGCLFCYIWYLKKWDGYLLMVIGFAAITFYHFLMYRIFGNDFTLADFWPPSLVKGFSLALLYISIGLFTTAKFGIPDVIKVAGVMVIVRSFIGSGMFSGLYSYFLYSSRIRHLDYLAALIDQDNFLAKTVNQSDYIKNIQNQATLTAAKEITGVIIELGLILILLLVTAYFYKKLKNTILSS
ncbi:hypothetical protein [Flavobacterium sp. LC2016-01]|uniref:hypothetical protein n=1 Tax=Flavobacterium sp. LC2016-01 TaxID=2675876 RepID=UPI0012BB12D2|nr:hypothetical protein [Flavobacterium sp. LC2016-01]MTH15846.1 hypothetical protein [Flavobacterium sp. LC2016-01]